MQEIEVAALDNYSERVNPYFDEDAGVHYAKMFTYGESKVFVIVPDITEEERKKRLQATLDIMSSIVTKKIGRRVRYTVENE
jgi:hypothetical protein